MSIQKIKELPSKPKTLLTVKPASLKNKDGNVEKKKKDASVEAIAKTATVKVKVKKTVKKTTSKSFDAKLVEKLKAIIAPYTEYPELLKNIEKGTDINFVEKLNIDSVDVVEIVVDVELEFDITVSDEEIKTFKTFEEMYNLIEYKINHPDGQ